MEKIKIKTIAYFGGNDININKVVNFNLKFKSDELINCIQLISFLGENVIIKAKLPDKSPKNLGTFMVKEFKANEEKETKIKFKSLLDYVNINAINELVSNEPFQVMFEAEVAEQNEGGEVVNGR